MPLFLRILISVILFVFGYVFFLISTFPMHAVKDRMVGEVENRLGPSYSFSVKKLDLDFFSGVSLEKIDLVNRVEGRNVQVWKGDQIVVNPSLFAAVFGKYSADFKIESGKSDISGDLGKKGSLWEGSLNWDGLDFSHFGILQETTGLNLVSDIEGSLNLAFDEEQPLRAKGELLIKLKNLILKESELKLGNFGSFPLPELVLSKRGSNISAEIDKGAISVKELNLQGGDLQVNLSGKVYLSKKIDRYRMNLQGSFELSPKMADSLALVAAIIQKQKGTDGRYPLSITGPIAKPTVKIGSFTLPL